MSAAETESIAKLDTFRMRKIAAMMVTDGEEFKEARKLFDLTTQVPAELLEAYKKKQANFDTAPFDPKGNLIRFFAGGYSIWSGYPGTGKTTILRQMVCHLLHNNKATFMASLEEDPGDLLIRLCAVAFAVEIPTKAQLQWFVDYYADSLRLWGVIGLASHRELFGAITGLSQRGVKHVILDSFMCLDVQSDDYEAQRQFANRLSSLVRSTGIHVHLVAHPRKAISADQEPDINDVAGSADLGRLADNILFIRRGPASDNIAINATAMKIVVKKQRHGSGQIGEVTGVLNRDLHQFKLDIYDREPTRYLPSEAYDE